LPKRKRRIRQAPFDAIKLIAASAYYSGAGGRFGTEPGRSQWLAWALAGGDDYELLFTAPASAREAVAAAARTSQTPVTPIGHIEPARGLRLVDGQGQAVANTYTSFDHFA